MGVERTLVLGESTALEVLENSLFYFGMFLKFMGVEASFLLGARTA